MLEPIVGYTGGMKRITKQAFDWFQGLSLGVILIFLSLGFLGSIYGLRQNSLKMQELRSAVFTADKTDGDIGAALMDLSNHVVNHMNTDLARNRSLVGVDSEKPIQLAYSYYRDTIDEYLRVTNASSPDHVATLGLARQACEIDTVPITERLSCIASYTADNGGATYPVVPPLSKDFYVFNFISPRWSPDLAGVSLFLFGLSIFMLALRFIVGGVASRIIAFRA